MNEDYMGTSSLVDTTDSLEAVGVFRGWKNFTFIIVLLCLLLVQVAFWLVNLDCIDNTQEQTVVEQAAVVDEPVADVNEAAAAVAAVTEQVDANEPIAAATTGSKIKDILPFSITADQLSRILRLVNYVLVFASMVYCMSLMFGLKVSLMGRLGGVSHVCKAFFLSMIMVILLLPWQTKFGPSVVGAIYMPEELFKATATPVDTSDLFAMVLFYLRFCGYWFLMFLLLLLAQIRSARWTKAILRRLEVI